MENKYLYRPLPDEESIRVLILDPGKVDEPLSGVLKVIHLTNRRQTLRSAQQGRKRRKTSSESDIIRWTPEIPYEAISYVWGSDVKDHIILLHGHTHQITANLSDALHQCRQTDKSRVLWADSICIDQDKLEEKNHQVYMMGRIYASSQRTLICLGTDPDNRDHARDALGVISDANWMIQEEFQRPGFSWEPDSFPGPLREDPLVNDSRWQSAGILLNRPWFWRGWVVQEAALGREATILWANCKIVFMDVLRVQTWYDTRLQFAYKSKYLVRGTSLLFPQILFHKQWVEVMVFFNPVNQLNEVGILEVLHDARRLDLGDPRDRIYAFMALPFVKNPMPDLRPDYNQPHLEIYRDFAVKYLETTSDLNILCYVGHEEVNGESVQDALGSSWVPRWDCRVWRASSGIYSYKDFGRTSTEPAEFMIMRGEDDAPAPLQVRAVIFDSIRLISSRIEVSMTVEDLFAVWSLWSKQAGSAIAPREVEPSPDNDSLAFLCALAKGFCVGGTQEKWAEMLKLYSRFLRDSKQEDPLSPGSAQISPDIRFCHRRLMDIADDSHIFSLERGYYGLGSWAIKQDDVCAFVFGVVYPIILRKVPDAGAHHYKVIGPADVLSKRLDKFGVPTHLHKWASWDNWDRICKLEGWTDWGLKEEKIILL
ncbi:hypothetical protein LA080_003876 [Diaporthe eres]|nr:hypothetical protein LA080_003876 [Diaporthe eres]